MTTKANYSGKQLLLNAIELQCTGSKSASMIFIVSQFPHMHLLDAKKVFDELEEDGVIRIKNGLIYKV